MENNESQHENTNEKLDSGIESNEAKNEFLHNESELVDSLEGDAKDMGEMMKLMSLIAEPENK